MLGKSSDGGRLARPTYFCKTRCLKNLLEISELMFQTVLPQPVSRAQRHVAHRPKQRRTQTGATKSNLGRLHCFLGSRVGAFDIRICLVAGGLM